MDTLPVNGWQVLQDINGLQVFLSGIRGKLDEEILVSTIQQALAKPGVVIPQIVVKQVISIPKASSGKTPLVKSNLNL